MAAVEINPNGHPMPAAAGGVLFGLAPPSPMLDGSLPLVELESKRLHEAMTWVYDSLRSLQDQVDVNQVAISKMAGVVNQAEGSPAVLDSSGGAPSDPIHGGIALDQGLIRDIAPGQDSKEEECRQRAVVERMQEIVPELVSSALREKMEDLVRSSETMQQLEARLRQVEEHARSAALGATGGSAAGGDGVSVVAASGPAAQSTVQGVDSTSAGGAAAGADGMSAEMEARFARLEASLSQLECRCNDIGDALHRDSAKAPDQLKPIQVESVGASGAIDQLKPVPAEYDGASPEEPRQLDAPLKQAEPISVQSLGASPAGDQLQLHEVHQRLVKLESHIESQSGAGDVHHQLVELHRAHTDAHRQFLEMGVRLQKLEQGGLSGASIPASPAAGGAGGAGDPAMNLQLANIVNRLAQLESLHGEGLHKLDDIDNKHLSASRTASKNIERVQQDLSMLVRYVSGEAPGDASLDEDGSPSALTGTRPSSQQSLQSSEWPLAWLEKRVEALIKKKGGLSIEARVTKLEQNGNAAAASSVADRLGKVEKDVQCLNVKDLTRVRPELIEHKAHQELISRDLLKEINELKCVVGCVEACIPRETRKAVQLFKRAAGSSDGAPASPREFAIDSKILQLREEMQSKIDGATDTLNDGRERMTAIVRNLEKKHDVLESCLEDVRRSAQPASRESAAGMQQAQESRAGMYRPAS